MVFKNKCSFQNESIKYTIVRWPSQTDFAVKAFGKACSELITIFIVLLCRMFDCTDIAIDWQGIDSTCTEWYIRIPKAFQF